MPGTSSASYTRLPFPYTCLPFVALQYVHALHLPHSSPVVHLAHHPALVIKPVRFCAVPPSPHTNHNLCCPPQLYTINAATEYRILPSTTPLLFVLQPSTCYLPRAGVALHHASAVCAAAKHFAICRVQESSSTTPLLFVL